MRADLETNAFMLKGLEGLRGTRRATGRAKSRQADPSHLPQLCLFTINTIVENDGRLYI